jgi:hypothetical protein
MALMMLMFVAIPLFIPAILVLLPAVALAARIPGTIWSCLRQALGLGGDERVLPSSPPSRPHSRRRLAANAFRRDKAEFPGFSLTDTHVWLTMSSTSFVCSLPFLGGARDERAEMSHGRVHRRLFA